MKKRIISLFTGLAILGSLCGCGSSKKDDEIVLTVFAQTSDYTGLQTGWFAQVIEEKFDVKLRFVSATEQNLMVQLSAEDLGDIIVLNGATAFRDAKNSGLIQDWDEFSMLQTYGQKLYDTYPEAFEKVCVMLNEDKVYGLCSGIADTKDSFLGYRHSAFLNWEYYSKAGYPEIQTLEDYAEVLLTMKEAALKEGKENIYGVSLFADWDNELLFFASSIAQMYGYEQLGTGYYDSVTGEWQDCLDKDGIYIRSLSFLNSLYRMDLLDLASMTQDYDRAVNKYSNGQVLFSSDGLLGSLSGEDVMYSYFPADARPLTKESNPYGEDIFWAIGTKSHYPEKCMEVISYLFSVEGKLTTDYGPKGITWDYDENGYPYLTEFGVSCMENPGTEMPSPYSGTYEQGINRFTCTTVTDYSNIPELEGITYEYETWSDEDTGGLEKDSEYLQDFSDRHVVSKASTFVAEYMDSQTALARNQAVNMIHSYSWNAIYAKSEEEFENLIDEMILRTTEYPYDKCITYYTRQANLRYQTETDS